ncbi:MAG: hypothetical protein O2815_02880 [Actinomycetota bacterium]|nr:hypothetical protein [Actinomycetota bacterium]
MGTARSNPTFDPDRILEILDRHGVDYVLVGGVAARVYGAERATADIDCVPATDEENLQRLADALVELDARLRVGGMTDDEARKLPLRLDAATLAAFGSSTWTTDAGPLDLLVELRDPSGGRHPYGDLVSRSLDVSVGDLTISVASLDDIIASKKYAGRPKDLDALPELQALRDEDSD